MALTLNDTCQARLQRVWRDSGKGQGSFPEPDSVRCQNESIYCNHFHWEDDGSRIPERDRHRRLQAFCADLAARTSEPMGHFELVDGKFSELVECNYQSGDPEEAIISRACHILDRLPPTAPKVNFHNRLWMLSQHRTARGMIHSFTARTRPSSAQSSFGEIALGATTSGLLYKQRDLTACSSNRNCEAEHF